MSIVLTLRSLALELSLKRTGWISHVEEMMRRSREVSESFEEESTLANVERLAAVPGKVGQER